MDRTTVTDSIPEYPNSQVTFFRRGGTFTLNEAFPSAQTSVMTDEAGDYSIDLWPNAEGLSQTSYLAVYPGKDSFTFVLPMSDDPIAASELRIQEDWPSDVDAIALGFAVERARYASTTPGLGGDLVGYKAVGVDAVARTVGDKLDEIASVFDVIPVAEHAAIRTGTSTYDTTADLNSAIRAGRTNEVPAGTYLLTSTLGTGFDHYTLLYEDLSNFVVRGQPGSKLIAGVGSNVRSVIFRRCSNFEVTGIDLENQGSATAGLCFENCDNGHIHKNRVTGFGRYGIVGSENTGTFQYQSSSISFDAATQQIRGVAGAFTGIPAGARLYLANSGYNNGFGTALFVAGNGSTVTLHVVEDDDITLVDEAAGTSTATLTSDTFSMSGTTLSVVNGLLYFLGDNDTFAMVGSGLNDGTYTVMDIAPDGLTLTVDRAFVNEVAGASITITRVGRPFVQVVDFAPMDNMVIDDNDVEDCDYFGIEWFAKAKSSNLTVTHNRVKRCGRDITAGSGIKAGTNYDKVEIASNFVSYCQMGIIFSNFEDTVGHDNNITNCYKWPIAISIVSHAKAPYTRYGSLILYHNMIAFVLDPSTGARFLPPVPNMQWLNINGLIEDVDLVDIFDNDVDHWGAGADGYGTGGAQFNKSYVPIPNINIHDNRITDSGGLLVLPMQNFTCTTQAGSRVLSNIANFNPGAVTPTAGWIAGAQPVAAGIPEDARIESIDIGLNTMTMTVAATIGASNVILRSGLPRGLEFCDNKLKSSAPYSNNLIEMYSDNGRCEGNTIEGFGQYPIQALCSQGYELWLVRNTIIRPNQYVDPVTGPFLNRGPFFLGKALAAFGTAKDILGTYHVYENRLDLGVDGHATYIVNSVSAGMLYMHNNSASDPAIYAVISGGVQPSSHAIIPWSNQVQAGTAAPTTGGHFQGDQMINQAPTAAKNIALWHTIGGGTPGTWAVPGWGRGTTAQRPTLALGDKEYRYKDTSIKRDISWDGTAWEIPTLVRTMFRGTADKTVGATTAENILAPTGVGDFFIPANYFVVGASVRIVAHGIIASVGTPTLRIRLKWGGTILVDTTALALPVLTGTQLWRLECLVTCRSIGASGTVEASMLLLLTTAAGVSPAYMINVAPTLVTVDTTVGASLGLTAQWGTSAVADTMTTTMMLVEDMY